MTRKIGPITGPGTSAEQFGVGGTDLGIPVKLPDGSTAFVFGDTFEQFTVGGPGWRSPVLLRSDVDLPRKVEFSSAAGGRYAKQLIDYQHANPEFSTVLPCDGITIGSRTLLWVMFTQGLGNERYCEIIESADNGETWTRNGRRWSTSAFRGQRVMMTWDRGRDGWVYAMSTGGLARNKNALLWRVREADILDPAKWEAWCWIDNRWQWKVDPADHEPGDIFPGGARLGELCLRWVQGNWVLSYFDAAAYAIRVKVAASPTANWHTAPTYTVVKGQGLPWESNVLSQLYGGYIVPGSKLDDPEGVHLIASQWNTSTNWPYQASQWSTTIRSVAPKIDDPTPSAPGTEWDPILAEILGTS
ncbi:DUF4185 domain-containing protein [Rhodococcus pyridinivorans]|uniref:DUF4185 domain-containing protein n=1 Tax=Rhodococcus pyridinivorans TaxID=103816 RepID=UPI003AAD642D